MFDIDPIFKSDRSRSAYPKTGMGSHMYRSGEILTRRLRWPDRVQVSTWPEEDEMGVKVQGQSHVCPIFGGTPRRSCRAWHGTIPIPTTHILKYPSFERRVVYQRPATFLLALSRVVLVQIYLRSDSVQVTSIQPTLKPEKT